jgi:hypothetical protein
MVSDVKAVTDRSCILVKFLTGRTEGLSVEEYEYAQGRARRLSNPRARAFHGVAWAVDCPPVERLTDEWQEVGLEQYRIWDREAYDVQMRQLLGIA